MEKPRLFGTVPAVFTVLGLFLLLLALGGPQRADAASVPFRIDFDDSTIDVSVLKDLPLDTLASDASLEGKLYDNGNVVIPKDNFKMPELGITTPVAIKGFMGIESDATGKFDPATGQLDLDAEAGLWVSVDVQQTLALISGLGIDLGDLGAAGPLLAILGNNLTCGFGPMDVHFTTESTSIGKGERFTAGPLGTGSITAEWSQLGPFSGQTKIFGLDACTTIKALLPGLLQNLGGELLGGIDLAGILNGVDLDNVDLGPSGITLIRSVDENLPPDPDPEPVATAPKLKLKISPRMRKAKAGRTIRYRARLTNAGNGDARAVSVCIKAPKKAVRVKKACQRYGTVGAGKTKVRSFRLKVKRGASGKKFKLGFRTRTSAKTKPKGTAGLRVR